MPQFYSCPTCDAVLRKHLKPKASRNSYFIKQKLRPFEHVHLDVMYSEPDRLGLKYHVILIDAASRYCFMASTARLTTDVMLQALAHLLIKFPRVPRKILLDRAPAFDNAKFRQWLLANGISWIYVSPRSHEPNGIVERVIGTLKRKCALILNCARLTGTFYSDALRHACYLYNRTHHSVIQSCPVTAAFGTPVDRQYLNRLRMFGCTVFYDLGIGLYLGQCPDSHEGTCLILTDQERLIRRNLRSCRFDETLISRNMMPSLSQYFLGGRFLFQESSPVEEAQNEDPTNLPTILPNTTDTPTNLSSTSRPTEEVYTPEEDLEMSNPADLLNENYTFKAAEVETAPEFFHQVLGRNSEKKWIDAMKTEIHSLLRLKTFKEVKKERAKLDLDLFMLLSGLANSKLDSLPKVLCRKSLSSRTRIPLQLPTLLHLEYC